MKVRKIKIGIKDLKTVLDDFVKTGEAIERGEKVKAEKGVYFTSLEAFRKALTSKRLELLRLIKKSRPKSLQELARIAKRDIKNVADDVKYLEQIGLVERQESKREVKPLVNYDLIDLQIAV